MTYEKEHSYLSRLAGKVKREVAIVMLAGAAYAGLDALLETISPSAKSAQAQEQRDKTLIEKIKEYEAKGDKTNADAQRELLKQELLKTPQSFDAYLKLLSSSQEYITPETLLKAAKNAEPGILVADKNASTRAIESLYRMLVLKSGQTTTKNTLFEFLLVEWQYSNMLADKGMAKYKADVSKAKSGITQAYSSMTAEEQAEAKKTAELYKLEFLVPAVPPKSAPAPEAKPEPKKAEPKPQPVAQPKSQPAVQPKTEPTKTPTLQNPSIRQAQPTTRQKPAQQETESGEPSYIELGTGINSNRSTEGNTQRASLITKELEFRGTYDFMEWKNPQDEMTTCVTAAGAAELKPLITTKIVELFGAEIPQDVIDFLTVGVAGESKKTTRRAFKQDTSEDSEFRIESDTATRETILDGSFSTTAKIHLPFIEFCGAGSARSQTFKTEVDNATRITNKKVPAGNYNTSTRIELENILEEERAQGEIKYLFETLLGEKAKFKGRVGILLDHKQTRNELADGTNEDIYSTLFGLTGQGNIADTLAFNAIIAQELFKGPVEKNNGWKDTLVYASILLRGEGKPVRDIHAKPMYSAKTAGMLTGWLKGKNWGAGAGFMLGTGSINADYLNKMLEDFGRIELGLNQDLGEALSGMEISRYMRIMPLAFKKGVNMFVIGGARSGRNEDNHQVAGAWGYAGASAGPVNVFAEYRDDHIAREIGGGAGIDFGIMRMLIEFINREDKRQKDASKTAIFAVEMPLG